MTRNDSGAAPLGGVPVEALLERLVGQVGRLAAYAAGLPEGAPAGAAVCAGSTAPSLLVSIPADSPQVEQIRVARAFHYATGPVRGETEALSGQVECALSSELTGPGDRAYFVGRVVGAQTDGQTWPGHRGGGQLEFVLDDEVYAEARQFVLRRHYRAGSVIDPDDLAFDLRAPTASATYALNRMVADGLVLRDSERGYVVVPFDVTASDEIFDARCAIEIGAIVTALEQTSEEHFGPLRKAFEAMTAELVDGRFQDFDRYLDANFAFHERVVRIAENDALRSAFGRLGIKAVMTRSFGATTASSHAFISVQQELLEGVLARDVQVASRAALTYRDLAKARVRAILEQTGGRL